MSPDALCRSLRSPARSALADRVLTKFFRKFVLGEKSEYIDDDGNVIKRPGQEYLDNGVAKQY